MWILSFLVFQRLLLHYILQEWFHISYLLATSIGKPSRDSKSECPALECLSMVFLCKEFPKLHLTLSSPGWCALEHNNRQSLAGIGGKYLYKQRLRLPEPKHSILSLWKWVGILTSSRISVQSPDLSEWVVQPSPPVVCANGKRSMGRKDWALRLAQKLCLRNSAL